MKIGILSRKASLYSTDRLVRAAKERGHEVEVVDYLRCVMNMARSVGRKWMIVSNASLRG